MKMKSGETKKLGFKKTTITHLNLEKINKIKDTLQRIKGGVTFSVSENGNSCNSCPCVFPN
jgi:hypothetical protein